MKKNPFTPGVVVLGMLLTACVTLNLCTKSGAGDLWVIFTLSLIGWGFVRAINVLSGSED